MSHYDDLMYGAPVVATRSLQRHNADGDFVILAGTEGVVKSLVRQRPGADPYLHVIWFVAITTQPDEKVKYDDAAVVQRFEDRQCLIDAVRLKVAEEQKS